MKRVLCLLAARIIGGLFVSFGLLGMLTPIPFGLIFFLIGLMFLVPTTPAAARAVSWSRGRIGLFDRVMRAAERRAPLPFRRVIRMTDPTC